MQNGAIFEGFVWDGGIEPVEPGGLLHRLRNLTHRGEELVESARDRLGAVPVASPGDHDVKQVTPPEADKAAEEQTVTVSPGGVGETRFVNQPLPTATATDIPAQLPTNASTPEPSTTPTPQPKATPIPELPPTPTSEPTVTTTVTPEPSPADRPMGRVLVTATDGEGNAISTGCIQLEGEEKDYGPVCDNGDNDIAGKEGQIGFPEVEEGEYMVVQTEPVKGYQPARARRITVEEEEQPTAVTIQNIPAGATLLIRARDDKGRALAGACYTITDRGGITAPICDDDGGDLRIFDLRPGEHTVRETRAPQHYGLAADQTINIGPGESSEVTFEHELIVGAVEITTGEGADAAGGACFELIGAETYEVCDNDQRLDADPAAGEIRAESIVQGDYELTETAPWAEHESALGEELREVAVQAGETARLTVEHEPLPAPTPESPAVRCGPYFHEIDMGDDESETGHRRKGWGREQGGDENPFTSPSGDRTKRYQAIGRDNSVTFFDVSPGCVYELTIEAERGLANDSWLLIANGRRLLTVDAVNDRVIAEVPGITVNGREVPAGEAARLPVGVNVFEVPVLSDTISTDELQVTFRNVAANDQYGKAAVYTVQLESVQRGRR